jgi:hypothetical protein
MSHIRPINKILDLSTYAGDPPVDFRLVGGDDHELSRVQIPVSVVYRLYHLGRAFDFQAVKLMHPGSMTRLEYPQLQLLITELEQVASIVHDPVSQHYLASLLPTLRERRTTTACALIVKGV